ncbi:MAG: hypothetical protein ACLFU0_09520 [Alphaproteobacteria bacterium]
MAFPKGRGAVHLPSRRLRAPGELAAMGVPAGILDAIAACAALDHTHATKALPATAVDYRRLLTDSFGRSAA